MSKSTGVDAGYAPPAHPPPPPLPPPRRRPAHPPPPPPAPWPHTRPAQSPRYHALSFSCPRCRMVVGAPQVPFCSSLLSPSLSSSVLLSRASLFLPQSISVPRAVTRKAFHVGLGG